MKWMLFLLLTSAASAQVLHVDGARAKPQVPMSFGQAPNVLGNGGFEAWSLGEQVMGSIAPDLWLAMDDSSGAFTQTAVEVTRQPASVFPGGRGESVMQARADVVGNFISQSVENFAEFRGQWVTFSVDVGKPFAIALLTVAIDDGVSSSETQALVDVASIRLTVKHRVHPDATMLRVRIAPEETVYLDNAQLVMGAVGNALYVPRSNPEPALRQVPLGTVLDWYRFDANIPVPEGYAICDGAVVTDAGSPFFGLATVDMSATFVRGVTDVGDIGTTGGSATVDLAHTHDMNHYHTGTTDGNNEADFFFVPGNGPASEVDHDHTFTTSSPKGEPSSGNRTGEELAAPVSIEPPFVGLLKIVRVK